MEVYGQVSEPQSSTNGEADHEEFKPKGAIAFFALLVLLGLIIWFGIYFLMLHRI